MRLWPRSLLGRNVLLLVVLIVVGQLFAGLIFRQYVQRPFVERLAATLANDLIAVQVGLTALPAEQREQFVESFNAGSQLLGKADSAPPMVLPAERMLMREVSSILSENGIETIWRRETGGVFYAELQVDGESYWLSTAGLETAMQLPRAAFVSWLAGIGLALFGAFLIQRRINRPLAQLVNAAHAVGRGENGPPLPETGPREIAAVCRSFNRMQEQLREQDRQRAIMLAGVSHDLRTPLTKIRLAVEMLNENRGDVYVESITRNCAQMDGIVQQFIDFGGIGSGEEQVEVDVNRLIVTQVKALEAPFKFEPGEIPRLRVREQALRRALTNLIENAWRYGMPDFTIKTGTEPGSVVICVQDRGPGIEPERIPELLKPFTRGSEARDGPPGCGLGLAIAARVVQMEGGRLDLVQRSGGGLEVRVELPVKP